MAVFPRNGGVLRLINRDFHFLLFLLGGDRLNLYANARKGAEHALSNLEQHGLEHFKAFALVFKLWIALSVAAQAYAVAQGVHVAQMFFPAAVKLFQQEVTKNIGIGGAGFCLELVKNAPVP